MKIYVLMDIGLKQKLSFNKTNCSSSSEFNVSTMLLIHQKTRPLLCLCEADEIHQSFLKGVTFSHESFPLEPIVGCIPIVEVRCQRRCPPPSTISAPTALQPPAAAAQDLETAQARTLYKPKRCNINQNSQTLNSAFHQTVRTQPLKTGSVIRH